MGRVSRGELERRFPGWARRVLVVPDRRVLYVKNAKAGTSTLTLWLHRAHVGDPDWLPRSSIHKEHALPGPADIGWDETARLLAGDAYRFAFVRHPLARAESAYLDKIVRKRHAYPGRPRLQEAAGLPVGGEHDITPEQFVAALERPDVLTMDAHWRPQHLNLMHPLVTYDHIGRLETFGDDLATIREASGLPDVPIEARNSTGSGDVFTGELADRLRKVYAEDCALYGY